MRRRRFRLDPFNAIHARFLGNSLGLPPPDPVEHLTQTWARVPLGERSALALDLFNDPLRRDPWTLAEVSELRSVLDPPPPSLHFNPSHPRLAPEAVDSILSAYPNRAAWLHYAVSVNFFTDAQFAALLEIFCTSPDTTYALFASPVFHAQITTPERLLATLDLSVTFWSTTLAARLLVDHLAPRPRRDVIVALSRRLNALGPRLVELFTHPTFLGDDPTDDHVVVTRLLLHVPGFYSGLTALPIIGDPPSRAPTHQYVLAALMRRLQRHYDDPLLTSLLTNPAVSLADALSAVAAITVAG